MAALEAATDLDALLGRSELLFTQDERGRLLRIRETDGPPAPRFYLARSAVCNVWRFRADLPRELVAELARLAGKERLLPRVAALADDTHNCPPPERMEVFRQALRSHGEIQHEYRGPAFCFPSQAPEFERLPRGIELVRLDATHPADRALLMGAGGPPLEGGLSGLQAPSALLPNTDCHAIVRTGKIVSACWTSRFIRGVGAEAGVHTEESERGRGFAARVVSAWASATRESGTLPRYSTQWTNAASCAVARRLGLILCNEDLHFG